MMLLAAMADAAVAAAAVMVLAVIMTMMMTGLVVEMTRRLRGGIGSDDGPTCADTY